MRENFLGSYFARRLSTRVDAMVSASEKTDSTQAVSIATMEEWEKELMEDPKVSLPPPHPLSHHEP